MLCAIDLAKGDRVWTIVDPGESGVVRDPDVRFDGARIVFSMRRSRDDDYHIYEVDIDGRNLRQLSSEQDDGRHRSGLSARRTDRVQFDAGREVLPVQSAHLP